MSKQATKTKTSNQPKRVGKKVINIILLVTVVIIVALTALNWQQLEAGFSGQKLYTESEAAIIYDQGYSDGNEAGENANLTIQELRDYIDQLQADIDNLETMLNP